MNECIMELEEREREREKIKAKGWVQNKKERKNKFYYFFINRVKPIISYNYMLIKLNRSI